ncbi:hypothetical protein RSOLAG22IIIB_09575 [Rhizoctonia solani]|uniref:Fungal lipase-like domain-containing protein n=1 Tax=Rhizoctonia solani TaxID=456999 RepID=A0A0K6FZB1_9AGAM|nr:hypothetical protein RSOLAG22IIIB_09575 [Rhizoctonia solani]
MVLGHRSRGGDGALPTHKRLDKRVKATFSFFLPTLPYQYVSSAFNKFQQIFALSWASKLAGNCSGAPFTIELDLLYVLNNEYLEKNVDPGWAIPGPDNVWFITKHDSFATDGDEPNPVYVVCIAETSGTGKHFDSEAIHRVVDLTRWIPASFRGLVDDFPSSVEATKPDFTGSAAAPYVSYGTAIGTHAISTIIGAACSTAAVVLDRAKIPDRFGKVVVYPTAGATPGDANFNITNTCDIVSHAWCTLPTYPQNLTAPLAVFGNNLKRGPQAFALLKTLMTDLTRLGKKAWPQEEASNKQNVYVPLPSSVFTEEPVSIPQTKEDVEKAALGCHIRSYIDLISGSDYKFPPGPCVKTGGDQYAPMGLGGIIRLIKDVPTGVEPDDVELVVR